MSGDVDGLLQHGNETLGDGFRVRAAIDRGQGDSKLPVVETRDDRKLREVGDDLLVGSPQFVSESLAELPKNVLLLSRSKHVTAVVELADVETNERGTSFLEALHVDDALQFREQKVPGRQRYRTGPRFRVVPQSVKPGQVP